MSTVLRSLMIKVGADLSGSKAAFKQITSDFKKAGSIVSEIGGGMTKALTVPIAGATVALGALVVKSGQAADEIARLSGVTGLSTDRIQELKYAGTLLDTSLEDIVGAQSKLIKAMTAAKAGTDAQAEAFAELGVAVTDGNGNLRDSNVVFGEVLDAMSNVSNETERDAIALKLFGSSALELNPLIKAGSNELARLSKEAHTVGAVIDGEAVNSLDTLNDRLESMGQLLTTAGAKIADALLPAVEKIAPFITDTVAPALMKVSEVVARVIDAFQKLSPAQQGIVFGFVAAAAAAGPLLSGIGSLVTALGPVVAFLTSAGGAAAIATSGIVLLVGAIAAINTALVGLSLYVGNADWNPFVKLWKSVTGLESPLKMVLDLLQKISQVPPPQVFTGFTRNAHTNRAAEEAGSYIPGYVADAATTLNNVMVKGADTTEEWQKKLEAFRDSVKGMVDQIRQATSQFANFTGAFDRVTREPISGERLARRMQGQLRMMKDWVEAMKTLKGKVSKALYSELLNLGPGAADQIMALANNDTALADYSAAWNEKYQLAGAMGAESVRASQQVDQLIERQVNTINVITQDPEAAAQAVVRKLRLAGGYR